MNPRGEYFSRPFENSREDHFSKRKNEVKRLMTLGHTKKRAQQLAKMKGY